MVQWFTVPQDSGPLLVFSPWADTQYIDGGKEKGLSDIFIKIDFYILSVNDMIIHQ